MLLFGRDIEDRDDLSLIVDCGHEAAKPMTKNNGHDMQRCTGSFHHQPVDDRDPGRAETLAISETEANMEAALADHGPERPKNDLCVVGDRRVTRERADACAIDRGDRHKAVQVDHAPETVRARSSGLLLLFLSPGFAHRGLLPSS